MSAFDSEINRIYKCTNKECNCLLSFSQKPTDSWKVKCPLCKQKTLLLESATSNISVFIGMNIPKTIGSLAEKNTEQRKKDGLSMEDPLLKTKRPFWRKDKKKIDYAILNNPTRYILEGTH